MDEIVLKNLQKQDSEEIELLALENGGRKSLNRKNITHWYFDNPHKSHSLWKAVLKNKIEGYAATNNFYHKIDEQLFLAGFPQNVFTSNEIRGKGIFKRLYFKTEIENIKNNKVDIFLTFTNNLSTPIFENKFGYKRGIQQSLLVNIPNPLNVLSKKSYQEIDSLDNVIFDSKIHQFENGREKDLDYYKWRYSTCNPENLKILKINAENQLLGYAFLIKRKVKGISILLLADIIGKDEGSISKIIEACSIYSAKKLYPALIMFDLSNNYKNRGINFRVKQKSVFQVKGKTEDETEYLSKIKFNFFYGDLDYFW